MDDLEFTPEEIAEYLFTNQPGSPCSNQIIASLLLNLDHDIDYQDNSLDQEIQTTDLFEILINILLKGLDILSGGLDSYDMKNINPDMILNTNPWFNSLGFNVRVKVHEKINRDEYNDYYCRVIIRDELHKNYFEICKIDSNYHFFLNGSFIIKGCCTLDNLFMLYIRDPDTVYTIGFDHVLA